LGGERRVAVIVEERKKKKNSELKFLYFFLRKGGEKGKADYGKRGFKTPMRRGNSPLTLK